MSGDLGGSGGQRVGPPIDRPESGPAEGPDSLARWFLPAAPGVRGAAGAWDEGCAVTTYGDGLAAMSAMRDALERAIAEAGTAAAAGLPPGRRGYVHLAAWRLNSLRDLSETNAWALGAWDGHLTTPSGGIDQTVIGLLLRLLQAGVRVRALLWLPTRLARAYGYGPHIEDHLHIARVVAAESRRLGADADGQPLGVVALDLRVAHTSPISASHHAKALVVRGHRSSVAFCGGVDLAYTRRHGPWLSGDWQSGVAIPDPAAGWPRGSGVDYSSLARIRPLAVRQPSDLPVRVYGDGRTVATRQLWHDQHLRVEGPVVATIEAYLRDRWAAPGRPSDLERTPRGCWRANQVVFSAAEAFDAATGRIWDLPSPAPVPPVGSATTRVQVWCTSPAGRDPDGGAPGRAGDGNGRGRAAPMPAAPMPAAPGGTYTFLAGTARACATATELIWIVDQYFWSRSLARLLNRRLKEQPSLHVLLLLPPYADAQATFQHRARALALAELVDGLHQADGGGRVAVYDLWYPQGGQDGQGRGIYAHAKTQLYDGSLLVCGSANLNRRSFTCDTELACAVLDQAVVADHQRRLWDWLFMGAPWPGVDLDEPGAGGRFFAALRSAVASSHSLLVPDPWAQPSPALPGGVARPDGPLFGAFGAVYGALLDPTSLPPSLRRGARTGERDPDDLLELAARLAACPRA